MRNRLTWLHISDIHFCSKTEWRDTNAREELLYYLKNIFKQNELLRPDFIFCTGDIAFGDIPTSPLSSQYAKAVTFFDCLLNICGKNGTPLPKERLFIVPGNHDVNRNKVDNLIQVTLKKYAAEPSKYSDEINQQFNDYSLGVKNSIYRLEDYANFVKEYLPHQHDEEGRHCFATVVDLDGLTVGIAGFNSAWTCAGPEDDRHLWLPARWQFNHASNKIKKAQIRLGIIHHPLDWLNEDDQQFATRRLSNDFHFWLHGHLHSSWVTPVNTHITIAAGAVGATKDTEFDINLVELDLLHSKGTVHLHTYNASEGGWKVHAISGHAPTGQWPLNSLPFKINNVDSFILSIPEQFNSFEYIDDTTDTTTTEKKFSENVLTYSDSLPEELKQLLIEDIISNAWEIIVFDPFLGNTLLSEITKNKSDNTITKIILPLCKISNKQPLDKEDVENILSIFRLDTIKTNNTFKFKCIILFIQLMKYIIYNKEKRGCIEEISKKLPEIREINEEFTNKFCTDIYFRNKCDFVDIPDFFHEQIKSIHDIYIANNETTPFARLSPILISPLQTISAKGFNNVLSELNSIAEQCSDTTECRWCLIAWRRITPLKEEYEDTNEFNTRLRLFINKFNNQLISKSAFLQYSYLKSLINSFVETNNITFLVKYEEEFIRRKSSIRLPQVILLQLEYASCLYIFCQQNDVDAIKSLKIVQLALDNQKITDNYLFSNIIISKVIDLQRLTLTDQKTFKKNVFQWLILYTQTLSKIFATPLIEKNHLNLRYIKAATKVQRNRSLYVNSTIKSLTSFYNKISQCTPSFCAKSCFCFELIGRQQKFLKAYIENALLADDYSITRNAKYIAQGLYALRQYNHDIDLDHLSQLEKRFCEVTRIGAATPKFFWIYYATGQLNNMPKEHYFIYDLGNKLEQIRPKAHQLKLRHDEVFSLTLSDEIISFIQKNKKNSIIAAILNIDLTNSETWNQLGTAVFDHREYNEVLSAKIASNFYTAAKCFAREKKEFDAKYCFNYIRCKSIYYLKSRKKAESFFINDTVHYLRQPNAQNFFYSPECVIDFFKVLNRDWNYLEVQERQKIKDTVNKVGWLKNLNILEHV